MLPVQALNSTAAIAANLDQKNLIVSPIPGTSLYKLCEVSDSSDDHVWGDTTERKYMVENVAESTNKIDPVTGTCLHNVEMTELVNDVSTAIAKHLSHAKSVVAPAVEDLVVRVSSGIEQVMRSDMNQLEIVVWRMPAPMYDISLIDSFKRASDIKPEELLSGGGLPSDSSYTQVVEWMKSGSVTLDAAIDQYISSLPEGNVMATFKELFTMPSSGRNVWEHFNDSQTGLDTALIGFLISRKLWDSPPEGTIVSLSVYEEYMVSLRNQCALKLGYELDRVERDENHKVLIRSYTRTSVEVNDVVYREWLKSGGDHSVIFGNVMSDSPALTVDVLNENTEKYKNTWNVFCTMQKTVVANKKFSAAKEIVAVEFDAMTREISEDILPIQERELARRYFNDSLEATKECEVEDLYAWSLRLLCDSWFHKTDAFKILDGINKVKTHSPEVSVKEAAAIATLEYVSEWVSSQFKVMAATR